MKRFFSVLFMFVLLCPYFSCKKEPPPTIVEGVIIDSKTGTPVSNATIEVSICVVDKIGLCHSVFESVKSDNKGNFTYLVEPSVQSGGIYGVYAENYVYRTLKGQFKWKMGGKNYHTIPLLKSDAALKITIKNETGLHDFVNVAIYNPTLISESDSIVGSIVLFPVNLSAGSEKEYVFPLIANEYTKIAWGFDYFHSTMPAHQDSVFLLPNDTLHYSLIF